MACACEKAGKSKCIRCKEAQNMGLPPAKHGCADYGRCD
jgi:hypothetical protein